MYPLARIPNKSYRGTVKNCLQCNKKIALSRWESWNGLLVRCPHCERINGENWNIKAILLGNFFFHALGFLFTMRLHKAIVLIFIFVMIGFFGNYILEKELLPQPVDVILVILFIFAPMIINAFLIYFHEKRLNHSAESRQDQVMSLLEELVSIFI